jgi:hypothetical protein
MKAKIKLELIDYKRDSSPRFLQMQLKLQGELFYNYDDIVVSKYNNNGLQKSRKEFYNDVIIYLSDINNIKKDGEYLLRKTLNGKINSKNSQNKQKEIQKLLKKLKQPIEIEIKY